MREATKLTETFDRVTMPTAAIRQALDRVSGLGLDRVASVAMGRQFEGVFALNEELRQQIGEAAGSSVSAKWNSVLATQRIVSEQFREIVEGHAKVAEKLVGTATAGWAFTAFQDEEAERRRAIVDAAGKQFRKILDSSDRVHSHIESFVDIGRIARDFHLGAVSRQIAESRAGFLKSIEPLGTAIDRFGEQNRAISALLNSIGSSPMAAVSAMMLADDISAAGRIAKTLSASEVAIATGALTGLSAIGGDEIEGGELDARLERIELALEQIKCDVNSGLLGLSWSTWQAWLAIILTLILTYRQDVASERDFGELRAAHRMQSELLEKIAEELIQSRPSVTGAEYVVIAASTVLRSRPDGRVLETVHRNQMVEVTGHQGKWLRVRYFDHVDSRLIEGWCRKKHLQSLRKGLDVRMAS